MNLKKEKEETRKKRYYTDIMIGFSEAATDGL